MSILYCWDHDEERVIEHQNTSTTLAGVDIGGTNVFCLDPRFEATIQRYGLYFTEEGSITWAHIPLEAMPKKFRANLLILGIT